MWITFIATVTEPTGAVALLQPPPPFQAAGLGIELIGLGLFCGICAFFGAWFGRAPATRRSAPSAAEAVAPSVTSVTPAAPAVTPAVPSGVAPGVTPDSLITAVIAAAIAATLDQPYRIMEIHTAGQAAGHASGMTSPWAMEGRFQHFSSHKLR